jgi:lambda family phage portal protein
MAKDRRSPRARGNTPRVSASADNLGFTQQGQAYEGAAQTTRTIGWHAPTTTPNNGVLGSLSTLRDRSRRAVRNDGYAKGTIDRLVTNIIGTGIKPLSQATDPEFRKTVNKAFNRWTDESDADGVLDFYGQQNQAVRAWLEGGESFTRSRPRRMSDGLSVPLQIQILEPELCPYNYQAVPSGKNRVRAGIEFDAIGRRVAYWFRPSRPDLDDLMMFSGEFRRVPEDSVSHLFDPLRPGQLRGVPLLTAALLRLWTIDKYDDATMVRQHVQNLFAGFLTHPESGGDLHPITGVAATNGPDQKPMVVMDVGTFQELGPGEDVKFSDPPKAPDTYPAFMKQQLRGACAATGVPYEVVTGDLSGLNDRVMRVLLNEFRRRIMAWQHQLVAFQFCRRVWNWWFDSAFLSGALAIPADYATDPEPYRAVKWMAQGWPYLNPVQDIQAARDGMRIGVTSRSAEVSERGEDAELIDQEQADDNRRADRLGVKYDSDGRFPLNAKQAVSEPQDPASQDGAATNPPNEGQ